MKWSWRWMIGDYVPIESGLPRRERKRILKPIFKRHVGLLIPAVYGGMAGLAFGSLILLGRRIAPFPIVFLYVMLFSLALNFAMGFLLARRTGPSIYRELRERGIDLCSKCNYDLHGLGGNVTACPECGAGRETQEGTTS
jgi:hypothetical protein